MHTSKKKNILFLGIEYFVLFLVVLLQYFQFQYATSGSISKVVEQNISFVIANFSIVFLINILVVLMLRKLKLSLILTSVFFSIWCIAHYYVANLHGGPLFISTLANVGAAMAVAGGYKVEIDKLVIRLMTCFLLQIVGSIAIGYIERKINNDVAEKKRGIFRFGLVAITILYLYIVLFSNLAIRPKQMIGWSWKSSINDYGFFLCALEDLEKSRNPFIVPENYACEKIAVDKKMQMINNNEKPDVILILNESFYDLDVFTELGADSDYFSKFYQIENSISGYAIVPSSGGGTNNSEYELLTSNSMKLLRNEAPFNYIDFTDTNNNVVQYFKSLGYTTYGFHGAGEDNYSRKRAYPELGFDNVFLGWDSSGYKKYGNRMRMDEDDYTKLIEEYEKSDSSKFMYLLSYQNHGGYEQNDESYDTVMTTKDFGDMTDDINEYITSISLSIEAFSDLMEYYTEIDKPVIICMVGDHAPSFINQLPSELSEEKKELYSRMVPYVIWSNYEVEYPVYSKYVSLTDFVPMIVEIANLPKTLYYQTILEVQKKMPIRTSYGKCYDNKLNEITLNNESDTGKLLEQYYFMEYNSLKAGKEYRADLFSISK